MLNVAAAVLVEKAKAIAAAASKERALAEAELGDATEEAYTIEKQVRKFSPYGSVCCACAQRPGLPRACHSG